MTPAETLGYIHRSHSVCRLTLTTKDPNKQAELVGEVRIYRCETDYRGCDLYIQSSDGKAWIEVPLERLLGIEAVPAESPSEVN